MSFGIGDRVKNKKLGESVAGFLEKVMPAEDFGPAREGLPGWDSAYPGWRSGLVAIVLLESKTRSFSISECVRGGGTHADYVASPLEARLAYPLADLEKCL